MEPSNLISIPEYIKLTGHASQNVYRWIRERRIQTTKVQKTIEIDCLPKDLVIEKKWKKSQKTS